MQRRSGSTGDHAFAARPQPRRDGVHVNRALGAIRKIDTGMHGGVIPAQLATREPATADCVGADECLPHARMLTAAADTSSALRRLLHQGCG